MKNAVGYESATETIRQLPQNYCLAFNLGTRWYLDFDLACDPAIAIRVVRAYLSYDVAYGTGANFINAINDLK